MLIIEDIIGAVVLLLLILVGLFFIYRNEGLHKNIVLYRYLKQAAAIFTIIFSSAVVLQVLSYNRDSKLQRVKEYHELAKDFYNNILYEFLKQPELNYYFENIFNNKPIPAGTYRDLSKERAITYLIFSNLGTIVSYENNIFDKESADYLDKWIADVMSNYVKSPIFVQYWKEYKASYGAFLSEIFMKKHFNL